MSATETQPSTKTHVAEAAKTTAENNGRIVAQASQTLEAAQEDLASIGGSLGVGTRDLGQGRSAVAARRAARPEEDAQMTHAITSFGTSR